MSLMSKGEERKAVNVILCLQLGAFGLRALE